MREKPGLRWFEGLEKAIASLATFPQRCPLAPENAEFPFEVRHLLYERKPYVYRILFTIDGDTVFVQQIRPGRRQPRTGSFSDEANRPAPSFWNEIELSY